MCARRVLRAGLGVETLKGPARRKRPERDLFVDPMPDRVEPCLAQLQSKSPAGEDWAFEVKWDGYRIAVHLEPQQKVRIITRGGHDWTHRFPSIEAAARQLDLESTILDGEAVVLDERGASDFGALQKALGGRGGKRHAEEAILYAFDLLYLNGHDLRGMPLTERRVLLEDALAGCSDAIRLSEEVEGVGQPFLDRACAIGLEGIIAKRRSSPYRSGRGGDWLKIKCIQSESFAIIGYEPSTIAVGGIGRLLLAARKGDELHYVGGVGTGFTHASGIELRRQMDKLIVPKAPLAMPVRKRGYRWNTPELVAEIAFRGWTDDGKLRHASYKGLRDEADEASIHKMGVGAPGRDRFKFPWVAPIGAESYRRSLVGTSPPRCSCLHAAELMPPSLRCPICADWPPSSFGSGGRFSFQYRFVSAMRPSSHSSSSPTPRCGRRCFSASSSAAAPHRTARTG